MVPPTCTLVRLVPAEHGRTGVGVGERAAEKGVGDAFAPNVVVGGHHADVQFAVAELIVEVAELAPAVSVERHIGRRVVAVPGVAPVGHDLHAATAREGHVVQRQPPPRVRTGRTGRPRLGQDCRTDRSARCHNIGVDQRPVGVTGVDPRRNVHIVHIVHDPGGLLGHLDQLRRGGHLAFRAVEDEPVTVAVARQFRHHTTFISGRKAHRHPAWSPGYRP